MTKEKKANTVVVYHIFPEEKLLAIEADRKLIPGKSVLRRYSGKGVYVTKLHPQAIGKFQKMLYGLWGHDFQNRFRLTDKADYYYKIEIPAERLSRGNINPLEMFTGSRKIKGILDFNDPEVKVSRPIKIDKNAIKTYKRLYAEIHGVPYHPVARVLHPVKALKRIMRKRKR